MTEPRRIGILGGTFDPPHEGHLAIARAARESARLDEVRFIPCHISPHKTDRPPTPAPIRVEMLHAAVAGLPWAMVDEREITRGGPSFSWETAEALRAEHPDARLFWILGADQWQALPRWARAEHLATLVEFLVFPRDGRFPHPRPGMIFHQLDADHPASATVIRQSIAENQPPLWLPPGVGDIIWQHQLYRAARPR